MGGGKAGAGSTTAKKTLRANSGINYRAMQDDMKDQVGVRARPLRSHSRSSCLSFSSFSFSLLTFDWFAHEFLLSPTPVTCSQFDMALKLQQQRKQLERKVGSGSLGLGA